jgi:hypothetical protein
MKSSSTQSSNGREELDGAPPGNCSNFCGNANCLLVVDMNLLILQRPVNKVIDPQFRRSGRTVGAEKV